jgi:two-component system, OmpR family, phosphate regulon response regulator PhoB
MANAKTVLIVEDDKHISNLIKYNLEKSGFRCLSAFTPIDAFKILNEHKIDIIVLDIMLPQMSGFDVCKQIREIHEISHTPIIMLTAKGEETDRITGFESGADDYLTKPFSPKELLLRIKAILKRGRTQEHEQEILHAEDLVLDLTKHKVSIKNKEISLTITEFRLLQTLMKRAGKVQSREKLLEDVWDIQADVTTRTVDTHVKRLREKMGKKSNLIESVRGVGYRFKEGIVH